MVTSGSLTRTQWSVTQAHFQQEHSGPNKQQQEVLRSMNLKANAALTISSANGSTAPPLDLTGYTVVNRGNGSAVAERTRDIGLCHSLK